MGDSLWHFHAGDLSDAEQSRANTNEWHVLRKSDFGTADAPPGWQGIGWFRIWVRLDTGLARKKISLRINHDGASEIFVDGRELGGYGKVGRTASEMKAIRAPGEIIPLWFNDTRAHLVAIRYSNFTPVYANFVGLQLMIGDYEARSAQIRRSKWLFSFVPLTAAAEIILGLLLLCLFLFYPRQKLNLYYALFVLLVGINGFAVYNYYQTSFPAVQLFADLLTAECKVLMMLSSVLLLYRLDYGRIPRWRFLVISCVSLFFLTAYFLNFYFFHDLIQHDYFLPILSVFLIDGLLSVIHLIRKKQKDAWLVATGILAIILVFFLAWGDTFGLWSYEQNAARIFAMSAGGLILPFCLSLYLALDFARTNQNLSARLAEVEKLSEQALAQEAEKSALIAAEAKRLEEIVEQRTAELRKQTQELREMDSVKSRFFTNITHEFKTPLTLIINPAKELMANPAGKNTPKYLQLIISNAARVLRLINQLLDLSKLESGLMAVTLSPLDLVSLIRLHVRSYESMVMQKGIELHFITDLAACWIMGDRDKLDKIILNLLSNAIKFTDHGQVELVLQNDAENKSFSLTVRDTGRGIPAAKLPYIFSRFYQVDPSDTRSAEGTGVGLAVAKELVELMHGQIHAESTEGLFTEMRILMPYQAAEVIAGQPLIETDPQEAPINLPYANGLPAIAEDDKPLILLIEDHEELRDFLQQILTDKFRVLSASDGDAGIALAGKYIPNVIITDLMMPGKDGYQVSATLKNDEKTSHIPIIILTAKADMDSRVQGIETGADAYLGKPFDKRELFAVIENLIQVRNNLREFYSRRDLWLNDTMSMPSIEQDFIARVRKAVESHLDEEGYGAEQLAGDIGLSRTQLHRKLKALIGQAPGELIRIVRLQYAHDLLQRRVSTVAEVAYKVGFSTPASFSTSFSRHFGYPPRDVVSV